MFLHAPAPSRRFAALAATLVLAATTLVPGPAAAGPGLTLVNATAPGTWVGLRDGLDATPDGRYVAFCGNASSVATTGLPGAGNVDVYVKDLQTGALSLVSTIWRPFWCRWLKMWKNTSCVFSLPARNCTSSMMRTSIIW